MKTKSNPMNFQIPQGFVVSLGQGGALDVWDDGGRKVARWSGHNDVLVFLPEDDGSTVRVGRYPQGFGLTEGLRRVQNLRNMERLAKIRKDLRAFEAWVNDVEVIVERAMGVDVVWDWPSRDSYDAGMTPHQAAVECIRIGIEGLL